MPPAISEAGKTYGRLTVIERAESNRYGGVRWLCRCDCGNDAIVLGDLLRRGTTQSCGCLRSESIAKATEAWKLPTGEGAFNWVYADFKRRAKLRGHEWGLTREQVREIISQPCAYCGAAHSNHFGDKHGFNGGLRYNGIDRVDNSKGYIPGNVAACCRACNIAKNDRSVAEFKEWARRLFHHMALEGNE